MTFTISAWGPDGRSVVKIIGPLIPQSIVDDKESDSAPSHLSLWTADENALICRLCADGLTAADIASRVGRTVNAVNRRLRKLGFVRRECRNPYGRNGRQAKQVSSTCLPVETAGRANPTLGNLLHAKMCGGHE